MHFSIGFILSVFKNPGLNLCKYLGAWSNDTNPWVHEDIGQFKRNLVHRLECWTPIEIFTTSSHPEFWGLLDGLKSLQRL